MAEDIALFNVMAYVQKKDPQFVPLSLAMLGSSSYDEARQRHQVMKRHNPAISASTVGQMLLYATLFHSAYGGHAQVIRYLVSEECGLDVKKATELLDDDEPPPLFIAVGEKDEKSNRLCAETPQFVFC